jgi:hypothetical protein
MENNIGVGLIVGLTFTSSVYVWNNEKFSSVQKTILLICIVFPPAQWIGILLVLAYNSNKVNNSIEKITERKVEQVKVNLDNSISNLADLKDKGILTEEEYKTKVAKINAEKEEQSLKNSLEYKQLKNLLDSKILTQEEFDSKIKLIQNISKKEVDVNKINNILNSVNKNYIDSLNDNPIYIRKIKIKDGTELTIHSYFKSGLREGDKVFINNNPALNGKYKLDWMDYITVENGVIK